MFHLFKLKMFLINNLVSIFYLINKNRYNKTDIFVTTSTKIAAKLNLLTNCVLIL